MPSLYQPGSGYKEPEGKLLPPGRYLVADTKISRGTSKGVAQSDQVEIVLGCSEGVITDFIPFQAGTIFRFQQFLAAKNGKKVEEITPAQWDGIFARYNNLADEDGRNRFVSYLSQIGPRPVWINVDATTTPAGRSRVEIAALPKERGLQPCTDEEMKNQFKPWTGTADGAAAEADPFDDPFTGAPPKDDLPF